MPVEFWKNIFEEDKDMIKLDEKKLAQLKTGSQHFDEKYGPTGSPSRVEFEAKAKAWYYAELLRDERKRQKLTQQQLAERIWQEAWVYIIAWARSDGHAAFYVHAHCQCFGIAILFSRWLDVSRGLTLIDIDRASSCRNAGGSSFLFCKGRTDLKCTADWVHSGLHCRTSLVEAPFVHVEKKNRENYGALCMKSCTFAP